MHVSCRPVEAPPACLTLPDHAYFSQVGTVFIHALSNLLSSFAHDATLSVEGTDPEDTAFHGPGGKPVAWGKQLPLPHIPYGQSREFYFSKPPVDALSVALTYTAWHTPGGSVVRADVGLPAPTDASRAIVRAARARAKASELISKGSALAVESGRVPADALSAVRQEVLALAEEVKRSGDDALVALGTDLAGEVAMALEPRFFKTWGAHYLRSLLFAHSYQQCNNFKDPGVQVYGSELFRNVRDTLDDVRAHATLAAASPFLTDPQTPA